METEQQLEKRLEVPTKKSPPRKKSLVSKKSSTKRESSQKRARQAHQSINHGESMNTGSQSIESPQRGVTNTLGSPPQKAINKYVSTVSYLRPATENKTIQSNAKHKPQRLASAGQNQMGGKMSRKKAALIKAINNPLNSINNIKSMKTRATNLSSQERDVVSLDEQQINIENKPGREIPTAIYQK